MKTYKVTIQYLEGDTVKSFAPEVTLSETSRGDESVDFNGETCKVFADDGKIYIVPLIKVIGVVIEDITP